MRRFFGWLLFVGGLILTAYGIGKLWSTGKGVPVEELKLIALVGGLWLGAALSVAWWVRRPSQSDGRSAITTFIIGGVVMALLWLIFLDRELSMSIIGAQVMGTGIGVGFSRPRRQK